MVGCGMTKEQVKEYPRSGLDGSQRHDIAHVAKLMEEQDISSCRLSDEQFAEVRRRRAEKNSKTLTMEEWD